MILLIRKGLVLLFMMVCVVAYGQDYFSNLRNIGIEDGLSHYKIHSFYPEEEGMWIGTEDGLNFFDGYDWKYWKKEEGQLNVEAVNYIYKDQEGFFWLFGAEKIEHRRRIQAIDILNQSKDSVITFEQKFGSNAPFELNDVYSFFEDQQKRIYFFANNQLWRYSSTTLFQQISLPQGFKPSSIFSDGTYIGRLNAKMALVTSDGKLSYQSDYLINEEDLLVLGTSKKFWTMQYGLPIHIFQQQPDGSYKTIPPPIQIEKKKQCILLSFDESQNHYWVRYGTYTYLYDQNENLLYQHRITPSVIAKDFCGNYWLGRTGVQLLHLQEKKFERFLYSDPKERYVNDVVYRCRGMVEKDGKLYVNSYEGAKIIDLESKKITPILKKERRTFTALKTRSQKIILANRKIFSINEDGSSKDELENKRRLAHRTWALFEDRNGQIWGGGNKGLYYLEDGKNKAFEKYNQFEELKNGAVLFFYKDKNGVIWIVSDKGLYQMDLEKGIIAGYGKNRNGVFQLPTNKFQHMHQDAQGIYWLASENAGLIRWNKATGDVQQFNKKNGFLTNNIYSVYEDDFDNLWMSSFNGIIRFQKDTKNITIYNEEEGISDDEFNRISHYQSNDGHIYFGSQNGITGFHPKIFQNVETNKNEFELAVKHVSVFGKRVQEDNSSKDITIDLLNLSPASKVMDFEIEGSNMFWLDKIDLHYTLEPVGEYQRELPAFKEKISFDNHVELFGMHPGTYNLKVKAIKRNGKQLGKTLTINFKINKPIIHQPIFWVFVLLATLIGLFGIVKFRTAHLHKKQIELEQLVSERTTQILKDQKTILSQAEQIVEMKDQLNRKDELWLEQFQNIIEKRLDDPDLYLPEIIDDMDISRSAFYEKVKTLTQMTPNQYIQEIRLAKAKTILEEGNVRTVKEVASSIGIKRPAYFSKLFKERFGYLPSEYFRNHKN